jgi:hypothetical protein
MANHTSTWGVTDFDATTGLPTIPEGYFWRVTDPCWFTDYVEIHLRKKRAIGSRKIGWTVSYRDDVDEQQIVHAACYLIAVDSKVRSHFRPAKPRRRDLLGDYFPSSAEPASPDYSKVTRICVVDEESGIAFERYGFYRNGVELHLQDEGRTLKVFPRKAGSAGERPPNAWPVDPRTEAMRKRLDELLGPDIYRWQGAGKAAEGQ